MNASNEEVSQEATTRSEVTAREATRKLIEEIRRAADDPARALGGLRKHLGVEPTDLQREHVAKRAAFKARLREEAAKVNRAKEQEGQSLMEAYEIVGETDACKWADYWLQVFNEHPEVAEDRDAMMAWFANAIMAGFDSHSQARPKYVIHVKVGGEMGDGMPPFVPGPKELAEDLLKSLTATLSNQDH